MLKFSTTQEEFRSIRSTLTHLKHESNDGKKLIGELKDQSHFKSQSIPKTTGFWPSSREFQVPIFRAQSSNLAVSTDRGSIWNLTQIFRYKCSETSPNSPQKVIEQFPSFLTKIELKSITKKPSQGFRPNFWMPRTCIQKFSTRVNYATRFNFGISNLKLQ